MLLITVINEGNKQLYIKSDQNMTNNPVFKAAFRFFDFSFRLFFSQMQALLGSLVKQGPCQVEYPLFGMSVLI